MQREDHVYRCSAFHLVVHRAPQRRLCLSHVTFRFAVPTSYQLNWGYYPDYTWYCYRIGIAGFTNTIDTIIGIVE